jgi:hypothetical protein
VTLWAFVAAAVALIPERACYVWIARRPEAFRRWCAGPRVAWLGEPVAIVRKLFYSFKVLQGAVFLAWCSMHGDGSLAPADPGLFTIGAGSALMVAGQALSACVFYRLGPVGVFYGARLGHRVPWCRAFPFSVLSHPQYTGAVLTIWGFFLTMRFPQADWLLLPVLETMYYAASTWLEEPNRAPRPSPLTRTLPERSHPHPDPSPSQGGRGARLDSPRPRRGRGQDERAPDAGTPFVNTAR